MVIYLLVTQFLTLSEEQDFLLDSLVDILLTQKLTNLKDNNDTINNSIDENAYLLGYSKLKTFSTIHLPYLKTIYCLLAF